MNHQHAQSFHAIDVQKPGATINQTPATPTSRYWQFSLRALLITMTLIAVAIALIQLPPLAAMILGLAQMLGSAMLVISIVYGRGWIRPFATCALAPNVITYFVLVNTFSLVGFCMVGLLGILATLVFGFTGALLHGYLARRGGLVPVPNVPLLRNWLSNAPIESKNESSPSDSN